MMSIRLIELFAGIGAQAKALENLGVDFEHYRVIENNRFAIASYNAVHKTNFPPMDITKVKGHDLGIVDTEHYTYIMTYSFPCTDISVAGKMKGYAPDSNTRSSLLWEVKRLLNECIELPQVLLMENVPMVHSVKNGNINHFNAWLDFLSSLGYRNYWQDLNAKDYGVAQNRNRCFCVSIRCPHDEYMFPSPIPLEKKLKDYLLENVDEKFYLPTDKARNLIDRLILDGKITTQDNGTTCDLSINNTRTNLQVANCILKKQDASISNLPNTLTGVIRIAKLGND